MFGGYKVGSGREGTLISWTILQNQLNNKTNMFVLKLEHFQEKNRNDLFNANQGPLNASMKP